MNNVIQQEDTIIAQSTSKGSGGALAVIRLTGIDSVAIVEKFAKLASKKLLSSVASHTVHYGFIYALDGRRIDNVLFTVMRSPKTFTGEDCVEISCHGNQLIVDACIAQAIYHGARPAQAGEFTKRAVLNGKIDLIQAEAINELIHAQSQYALRKSLEQMDGTLSQWLLSCQERLLRAFAFCEVSFDFLEEDVSFKEDIKQILEEIFYELSSSKKALDHQKIAREGLRVALIGSVNSGKSSLFNMLVGQKRAIVTHYPGTTRDTIESTVTYCSNIITFIDTAGLRTTQDVIEKEGIVRSFQEAKKADIILLVYDVSRQSTVEEREIYKNLFEEHEKKIIVVGNKADLPHHSTPNQFGFLQERKIIFSSCVTHQGIVSIQEELEQRVLDLFERLDVPFLLNKRHLESLNMLEQKIRVCLEIVSQHTQYEILSCHLRESIELISELTGKSVTEYAMDVIFKQFCVGK